MLSRLFGCFRLITFTWVFFEALSNMSESFPRTRTEQDDEERFKHFSHHFPLVKKSLLNEVLALPEKK